MPKVYIVDKASHDYSKAEEFGELVYLTEGRIGRYSVNSAYRSFEEAILDSDPEDYVLMSGLRGLVNVLTAMFVARHGRVNWLMYSPKEDIYILRRMVLNQLNQIKEGKNNHGKRKSANNKSRDDEVSGSPSD